jgi:putative transposase
MRSVLREDVTVRLAVFEWIEGSYNPHRRHSSLGRISPINFERRYLTSEAA